MRRRPLISIVILSLAVLAGPIVTFAVAQHFARTVFSFPSIRDAPATPDEARWFRNRIDRHGWAVDLSDPDVELQTTVDGTRAARIRNVTYYTQTKTGDLRAYAYTHRYGLPFRCMGYSGEVVDEAVANGAPRTILFQADRGYRRVDSFAGFAPFDLVTEVAVVPFVANSIFYSGLLVLPVVGTRIILRRRRVRLGACTQCGYRLGETQRCPECGFEVMTTPTNDRP